MKQNIEMNPQDWVKKTIMDSKGIVGLSKTVRTSLDIHSTAFGKHDCKHLNHELRQAEMHLLEIRKIIDWIMKD